MILANGQHGVWLAERLALKVVGREGHDLKVPCVACKSSDAGRVDSRTGVFHCYSCKKGLSGFDLAKCVLADNKAAVQVMIDVGLFQDYMAGGNGKPAAPARPLSPIRPQPLRLIPPCRG